MEMLTTTCLLLVDKCYVGQMVILLDHIFISVIDF